MKHRPSGPARHDRTQLTTLLAPGTPFGPGHDRPDRLPALAQRLLLERYAPTCVVIDSAAEILYFHGPTDQYLVQPTGRPTHDLFAQSRPGLRSALRSALGEASRRNERVVVTGAQVRRPGGAARVTLTAEPLQGADVAETTEVLWLVSFEDEREPVPPPGAAPQVRKLESELETTRSDLQRTIEDLQAANEALMSLNEELQSSNEELETSKEELQSLNEELTTANTELEAKIAEVEAANNDLDNLLTSTNIATLFLDADFRIRRFTPAATRLFSLIPADIGRPIGDIVQKFTDPDLLADAVDVRQGPFARTCEVRSDDGRWYVRQVLPYRTRDGRTDGVVITLSDVAADALHEARLYAESIVDTVREPLLVLDSDLHILSANRPFYTAFHLSEGTTAGRSLYELGAGEWDIPRLRTLLSDILPRKRELTDFEMRQDFQGIGPRIMLLNARALRRGGDRPALILLALEDVTDRTRAQEELRESEARKPLEEQLRQRQADLAHALRIITMGELASGLAHELNQPLSAIANSVEACARYVRSGVVQPAKLLALLDDASSEARRAGDIVQHLRGFIEKGKPRFQRADLGDIARNVQRLLGHELTREGITLRLDLAPPPVPIHADRIQIEQVLVNLMQNAIDAEREADTDCKRIELVVRTGNGKAELAVRDRGPGLTAAATDRLFDPFFTTKGQGLGMGLAISRSIIEAHRGRIWVERPADGGPGTIVSFSLPLHTVRPVRRRRSA